MSDLPCIHLLETFNLKFSSAHVFILPIMILRVICQPSIPHIINALFTKLIGVYELRIYDIVLGKTEQWVHRLVQGLPDRCKLSEPVGIWFTEFGPVNTGKFIQIKLYSYERLKFLHKFMFELFF